MAMHAIWRITSSGSVPATNKCDAARATVCRCDIIAWGNGSTDQEASEDHYNNLRKLLQIFRDVILKLKRDQVELKQTKINYLGHIISSEGLRADPKKIDAAKQVPPPVDKAGVQRLLERLGTCTDLRPTYQAQLHRCENSSIKISTFDGTNTYMAKR